MENKYQPLPTIFFPFPDRKIYRYCYQMNNGKWIVNDRANVYECFRMCKWCARFGTPFRFKARSDANKFGTVLALLLDLFFKRAK